MNRIKLLKIMTTEEFKGCKNEKDITKAWGYFVYQTGEIITREEFVEEVEAAHKFFKATRSKIK